VERAQEKQIKELRRQVEAIAEKINYPYKSESIAKEYVEELKFNSKISWDDPMYGADATNKHVRDMVNGVRDDERSIRKEPFLFFQDAFDKSMVFCGMKYDKMLLNLKHDSDWDTNFDLAKTS
jgi:vacuolar-type H+-ATPase subunit B/Vma2